MNKTNDLMKETFVSFFFLGKAPVAPGTFGSLGSLIIAYFIVDNVSEFSGYLILGLGAIMYYTGLQVAPWCEEKYGKDPGIYVLDEVIGFLMVIAFLNLLQFLLFNLLFVLGLFLLLFNCHLISLFHLLIFFFNYLFSL